jgi:hypothetical protein
MRNSLKTILFVSAFSPTLLVLAAVRYFTIGTVDTWVTQLFFVSLLGIFLPFLIIGMIKKESETSAIQVRKVESADYYLIVFIASYASPLVMKMVEIDFLMTTLITAVVFLGAWFISNIPSHPLLYLVKFRFYKIESLDGMVYMLVTRKNIRTPKEIHSVKKISNSMLME